MTDIDRSLRNVAAGALFAAEAAARLSREAAAHALRDDAIAAGRPSTLSGVK